MQDHATDPGVFIRSMATRGHLGGLALAAPEAIRLLAQAYAENATRITKQIPMEQKQCGFASSK